MNGLIVAGLFYDIVGVCILAVALALPRAWVLRQLSIPSYSGNKAFFRALLLQRKDAQFGLPIVVAGFALQFVGAVGLNIPGEWLWLVFIPLVLWLVAYVIARRRTSRTSDRIHDELRAKKEAASGK